MVGIAVVAQRRAKARPVLPPPTKTLATGVKVRIFAADSRRIPSTKAKVLDVAAVPRWWGGIEVLVQLIVGSTIPIIGSAMMGRLSEHRRGDSSRNNSDSA